MLANIFLTLKGRLLGSMGSKPVKYKTFAEMGSDQFERFINLRKQHPVKSLVLQWLETEATLPEYFSILDIGCGPGVFLNMLLNRASLSNRVTYTGVDQSRNALNYCRQRYPSRHRFVQRDVLQEGLPDEEFDVIAINEVVEHMPDYRRAIDLAMARKPKVFVLTAFAIEPSYRRSCRRWNRKTQCYMNYYSFQEVYRHLRRAAENRPLQIADFGTRQMAENRWFPVKTETLFYLQLAREDADTRGLLTTGGEGQQQREAA